MADENKFEVALHSAIKLPLVNVNREKYLRSALKTICTDEQIELAIKHNPAYAGVHVNEIDKLATSAINYEVTKVTTISAASGLPGGVAMVATIPADVTQVLAHQFIIAQKLVYLYGWGEVDVKEDLDDGTKNEIIIFIGSMYGLNKANDLLIKISKSLAQQAGVNLAKKALTKTFYYPIIKNIAKAIGVKMTKQIFARGVSKVIPVVGAVASGGLTFVTFKPMANKLKKHLRDLKLADVAFYHKDNDDNSEA